jgi:RNA polymerase sigma factor (sigma-70 family)
MDEALTTRWPMAQQDERISEAIDRNRARLRKFIRSRVTHPGDADDILQEVFFELVEAYRMMKPVEQVTAWLFRVARNRITDLFRRKARDGGPAAAAMPDDEDEAAFAGDLLPSLDAGPEAEFARNVLMEELYDALEELPEEQREVFIAHELEGHSFKELAERFDVSVNTLLSRKHYAVLHLRERLRAAYDDLDERIGIR